MRVALFVTCLADAVFPEVGKATVALLERLGHEVEFPAEQTCCGQMHINTGYQREALPLVRHQHAMVARGAGDPALARRAEAVSERTYELSELLVDVRSEERRAGSRC